MSKIEWGPEIKVDGKQPDWLDDNQGIADSTVDTPIEAGHWPWPVMTEFRLPADHPYYAKPELSGADGSSYYDLQINGVTVSCNDVIDALGMSFNMGEAFKALWRCGRKPGTSKKYDLDKVVRFAQREANRDA